jgi:hypothetical protein
MTDRLPPKSEPRGCFRPPEPPPELKSKMYIYEKDSEGRRVAKEVERFIGKKSDELRQKEADDFLKYLVKWSESADVDSLLSMRDSLAGLWTVQTQDNREDYAKLHEEWDGFFGEKPEPEDQNGKA